MKVRKTQNLTEELTGWIIRRKANSTSGKLFPNFAVSNNCVGRIGDLIVDPIWLLTLTETELINKVVGAGCLHVFKHLSDAKTTIERYGSSSYLAIVEVAIQPGLLLIGQTVDFCIMDPLECYGCKSYRMMKIVENTNGDN
jgi:hypothetical protein